MTILKYADDLVVISEIENMISKIIEVGRRYGMVINIDKSKVIRMSKRDEPLRITVGNRELGDFDNFK